MSEENVKLVLKDLKYWNEGDMDAFVELWDDDVVLRAAEGWPERDFRGKDAVRSFYEGFAETVGRDSLIEDLIDAGDVVVTRMRAHMTGVQSGLEGDMRFSQVTTFREGKVVRAEFFWRCRRRTSRSSGGRCKPLTTAILQSSLTRSPRTTSSLHTCQPG